MKNIFPIAIKLALIVLLVLCLFKMPFGYYQLVRFAALAGFALLAVDAFQNKRLVEATLFICLALLFQPFIKVALEKEIWHWVDIALSAGLFISIPIGLVKQFGIKKEIEMQPKKGIQKIIAREFLILLVLAVAVGLIYLVGLTGQKIVQTKIDALSFLKDSLETEKKQFGEFVPVEDLISAQPSQEKNQTAPRKISSWDEVVRDTPIKNKKADKETEFIPPKDAVAVPEDDLPIFTKKIPSLEWLDKRDSIDNSIKTKIHFINIDIYSKMQLNYILENLWPWALAMLTIVVYPIRLLVLVTLWAIKTVKA